MFSELSLTCRTAHEHLSTEFLNVHKNNMVRKTVFGGLIITKAQTSLRFRSDLELTLPYGEGLKSAWVVLVDQLGYLP